jgi:hypothetical protein
MVHLLAHLQGERGDDDARELGQAGEQDVRRLYGLP